MIRSALAVLAGYLTMVIGVTAFFAATIAIVYGGLPDPKSFRPPSWLLVVELVVATFLAGGGGYVCAFVARRKEMAHAVVLCGVMIVLGFVSAFIEAGTKPLWSSVAIPLVGAAGVLAGARLRVSHATT